MLCYAMLLLCLFHAPSVKFDENKKRYGYTNTPIGHNHFQSLFDHVLLKTADIKNKYKNGTDKNGRIRYGHHYPIGQWRKSVITLYGAAGLSTSQIQTYTMHASAQMVDHYVQKHNLKDQRRCNDLRIRDFIKGRNNNKDDELKDDDESPEVQFEFNDDESEISASASLDGYSRMLYIFYFYILIITNHLWIHR